MVVKKKPACPSKVILSMLSSARKSSLFIGLKKRTPSTRTINMAGSWCRLYSAKEGIFLVNE